MAKKRVLSGIRATGRLHLGNYLGAVKGMLALQDDPKYETFYTAVDLHTMTTPYETKTLASASREVVLDYLASGLDPKKSGIFLQSHLADLHAQLAFYFSTVVSVARMSHLPTYKEKIKQHPKAITMALLNYPVLMAADILIYKASAVPVGIDQEPHLEVAREVARKMNAKYGTDFPEPTRFATKGEYVPSLIGEGKMSKSVEGSYINLTDDLKTIKTKLAGAPTDSGKGEIRIKNKELGIRGKEYLENGRKKSKGVMNLLILVELFHGEKKRAEYEKRYLTSGIRYKKLKDELAKAIIDELKPIQKKRAKLEKDPVYVEKVLEEGAERARKVAEKTIAEVKEKMGLR